MSPIQKHLHALNRFETPEHLYEFALMSTDILDQAHIGTLEPLRATLKVANTEETFRAYLERKDLDHPVDYELLAVHLGRFSLAISLDHRHVNSTLHNASSRQSYTRSTVMFQNNEVKIFHMNTRGIAEENITHNEEAGHDMTSRLRHSLAVLGIQQVQEELPILRAS